jgi:hypothetical protein
MVVYALIKIKAEISQFIEIAIKSWRFMPLGSIPTRISGNSRIIIRGF